MGRRVAFGVALGVVFFFAAMLRARAFAGVEGVLGDFDFVAGAREVFREIFREGFWIAIARVWRYWVLRMSFAL